MAVRRFSASAAAAWILIPTRPSAWSVAGTYLALGIEHILTGLDHLLFVLALLLLTKGTWRLVKTVTAFTLAHSITLGLATLGIVHVPSRPVEAVIALSIVFVAAEIVQARQGRSGLAAQMPWIVAFIFGLVHGFGFAGALSEVGLPEGHIPVALLFFNLGVEQASCCSSPPYWPSWPAFDARGWRGRAGHWFRPMPSEVWRWSG